MNRFDLFFVHLSDDGDTFILNVCYKNLSLQVTFKILQGESIGFHDVIYFSFMKFDPAILNVTNSRFVIATKETCFVLTETFKFSQSL